MCWRPLTLPPFTEEQGSEYPAVVIPVFTGRCRAQCGAPCIFLVGQYHGVRGIAGRLMRLADGTLP